MYINAKMLNTNARNTENYNVTDSAEITWEKRKIINCLDWPKMKVACLLAENYALIFMYNKTFQTFIFNEIHGVLFHEHL